MSHEDARFGDPHFEQMVREAAYGLWERTGGLMAGNNITGIWR